MYNVHLNLKQQRILSRRYGKIWSDFCYRTFVLYHKKYHLFITFFFAQCDCNQKFWFCDKNCFERHYQTDKFWINKSIKATGFILVLFLLSHTRKQSCRNVDMRCASVVVVVMRDLLYFVLLNKCSSRWCMYSRHLKFSHNFHNNTL